MKTIVDEGSLPRVSIALCTYNGARHLDAQLQSLHAQSFDDFEIVAVDDGSTDGTWEVLCAQVGPRFRVHRNETTRGVTGNFEHAFTLCRGEFIAPCDQDEVWHPRKLARLADAIGAQPLAYCDSELVDAENRPLGRRISDHRGMLDGDDPLAFAFGNSVSGHALIFRRSLLAAVLPIPQDFPFYDWWIAAMAADRGGIVYVPEALVRYRQHAAAVSDLAGDKGRRGATPMQAYRQQERCLHLLASRIQCQRQAVLRELAGHWSARRGRWWPPRLVWLAMRHGTALWRS